MESIGVSSIVEKKNFSDEHLKVNKKFWNVKPVKLGIASRRWYLFKNHPIITFYLRGLAIYSEVRLSVPGAIDALLHLHILQDMEYKRLQSNEVAKTIFRYLIIV